MTPYLPTKKETKRSQATEGRAQLKAICRFGFFAHLGSIDIFGVKRFHCSSVARHQKITPTKWHLGNSNSLFFAGKLRTWIQENLADSLRPLSFAQKFTEKKKRSWPSFTLKLPVLCENSLVEDENPKKKLWAKKTTTTFSGPWWMVGRGNPGGLQDSWDLLIHRYSPPVAIRKGWAGKLRFQKLSLRIHNKQHLQEQKNLLVLCKRLTF